MDENVYNGTHEQIDTMLILKHEELPFVRDVNLNEPYLPQHRTIKRIPNHPCYGLKGEELVNVLRTLIMELLHGGKICSNYPQERHPSYLSKSYQHG